MSTIEAFEHEATVASLWQAVAGATIDDGLLEWPPDLFALADVLLERSEAYRFAFSPPAEAEWPPRRTPSWADAVSEAGRQWAVWVDDASTDLPSLLAGEWATLRDAAETPLTQLRTARDWQLCVALLTLHAIADEACAGLGVALTASRGSGASYRARARELLARRGTLARIPPHLLRVLPKIRTSPSGSSPRSLSRYACVHDSAVEARWNKVPVRRAGTEPRDQGANFLLLPWPLRVRESDFRPLEGSVQRRAHEPFGFFEFAPSEQLDLDLMDRTIVAAKDEAGSVDAVVLPECAVAETEVDDVEALLHSHRVPALIAGIRQHVEWPGRPPGNWVHIGVSTGDHWVHIRQNKHHRWSLDEAQIYQYHLGGALHPHIRWWEASEVPNRSVQFIDVGEGIVTVSLVCEDLAQIDPVADLLRSVGPTIVITPLLDGPQLGSRWAARYASVLADDPGSAVLTLTSVGMAERSRPHGHEPARVVALWKDPIRGSREIRLEPGAQGILLTASGDLTIRRSSDGRNPIENCTQLFDVGIYQVRATAAASQATSSARERPGEGFLEAEELTVLMSWAEAMAEVLAYAPERIDVLLDDSRPGARWRAALQIQEPSAQLATALETMRRSVRAVPAAAGRPTLEEVLTTVRASRLEENELELLAHRVLRSALEQRQVRRTREGASVSGAVRDDPRHASKAA